VDSVRRRHRWRSTLVAGVSTVAAAALGLSTNLTSALIPEPWLGQHKAVVWVITAACVIATVVLAVIAVSPGNAAHESALADVRRALANAIRQERQRFVDQALGVRHETQPARVSFADLTPGSVSATMESLLLNWQAVDGRHAGSINTIADFYGKHSRTRVARAPAKSWGVRRGCVLAGCGA
jgi:hypothetical protein